MTNRYTKRRQAHKKPAPSDRRIYDVEAEVPDEDDLDDGEEPTREPR
jgi:hypothetical protein